MLQTNRPLITTTSSTTSAMPPARGTKTLAWFMDNDILKNGEQQQQGAMMQNGGGRRGSSSDVPESKSGTPSAQQQFYNQQQLHNQQQKKYRKFRKTLSGHGAARKEGFSTNQAMSESSEDGNCPLPPPVTLTTSSNGAPQSTSSTTTTSSSSATPSTGASSAPGANNEEYWFYDVATDGYYYEQNGAKGWRRRQPNAAVHKANGKDQEVAHMNVNGPTKYNQLLAAQAAAAQAAFLQHAFQFQQAQAAQAAAMIPPTPPPSGGGQSAAGGGGIPLPPMNPTMRYYDPNSDGFFYEMASVDGWKRRQPNKPVSASVPAGITRPYSQRPQQQQQQSEQQMQQQHPRGHTASYGAALARGQFPRNTVKQQGSTEVLSTTPAPDSNRDSASSSQCGDTFAELFNPADPVFNPIQRPSALNLEQKAVSPQLENAPNSTAALFDAMLADLNGYGGQKPPMNSFVANNYASNQIINPLQQQQSSQSPMKESWNSFRSCSLFSPIKPSKRVLAPIGPIGSNHQVNGPMGMNTPLIEDMNDDRMKMLMKDFDQLWATTPVTGLNLA